MGSPVWFRRIALEGGDSALATHRTAWPRSDPRCRARSGRQIFPRSATRIRRSNAYFLGAWLKIPWAWVSDRGSGRGGPPPRPSSTAFHRHSDGDWHDFCINSGVGGGHCRDPLFSLQPPCNLADVASPATSAFFWVESAFATAARRIGPREPRRPHAGPGRQRRRNHANYDPTRAQSGPGCARRRVETPALGGERPRAPWGADGQRARRGVSQCVFFWPAWWRSRCCSRPRSRGPRIQS